MQPNVSRNHDGIHACFILKLKDFCNTCVHFQWKKTNSSRHIRILSALRMCCACVVCMTSASSWPNCVSRVARIVHVCMYSVQVQCVIHTPLTPWECGMNLFKIQLTEQFYSAPHYLNKQILINTWVKL